MYEVWTHSHQDQVIFSAVTLLVTPAEEVTGPAAAGSSSLHKRIPKVQ